jgi:hypothetical protein
MRITKSSPRRHGDTEGSLWQELASVWNLVKATLREIFDESAYDRFLFRTGKTRSAASYREFLKETETALARKPRCC